MNCTFLCIFYAFYLILLASEQNLIFRIQSSLEQLRDAIKIKFYNKIKENASQLYLENKDELFKFQIFRWVLSHSEDFYKDFLNHCY